MKSKMLISLMVGIIMIIVPVLMYINNFTDYYKTPFISNSAHIEDYENQELPKLILTIDDSTPAPGGTINLTARFSATDIVVEGVTDEEFTLAISEAEAIAGIRLLSKEGVDEFDKSYPYEWSMTLPKGASGSDEFQVIASLGPELIGSNIVSMVVELDRSNLHEIYFDSVANDTNSENSELPKLILTVDNSTPKPGETFSLTPSFEGVSDQVIEVSLLRFVGDTKFGNFVYGSVYPPDEWSIAGPKTMSGIQWYQAVAKVGDIRVSSEKVKVVVMPDVNLLHQIYFNPGYPAVMTAGGLEVQMEVIGRFKNGYNYIISRHELGTVYSENIVINNFDIKPGDSPVINVSEDGLVTALQPGEAEVVATNNGITNVRRIKVIESAF